MKTGRTMVNMPASHGAIGDIYNFRLPPSLTLGCGTWGGNSVTDNVGVRNLLNIKTVAKGVRTCSGSVCRRKSTSKPAASPQPSGSSLKWLKRGAYRHRRDAAPAGHARPHRPAAEGYGHRQPDFLRRGARPVHRHGGQGRAGDGSLPAGRHYRRRRRLPHGRRENHVGALRAPGGAVRGPGPALYGHPQALYPFPKTGGKALLVCVPTTAGTGSEISPFTVITDNKKGLKYPWPTTS